MPEMPRENKYVLRQGAPVVRLLSPEILKVRRAVTQCAGLDNGCEQCAVTAERRQMIAARRKRG